MKNSEVCYPISGSSALHPDLHDTPSGRENIIAFPGMVPSDQKEGTLASRGFYQNLSKASKFSTVSLDRLRNTEMVRSLRYGSAQGVSFNRISRWQAVVACVVFCAMAFAALFLKL